MTLVCGPVFALIWFPEQIDDFTYAAWYRGYQVDSRTPSLAIALMDWFFLILFSALFFAHLARQ